MLLDPTWGINRMSTLTPTYRKVFKGIRAVHQGSQTVRESNVVVLKSAIKAVGHGVLDSYLDDFLQSSTSIFGRVAT